MLQIKKYWTNTRFDWNTRYTSQKPVPIYFFFSTRIYFNREKLFNKCWINLQSKMNNCSTYHTLHELQNTVVWCVLLQHLYKQNQQQEQECFPSLDLATASVETVVMNAIILLINFLCGQFFRYKVGGSNYLHCSKNHTTAQFKFELKYILIW